MFVHLNCHSHYSLLAGTDRVDALVRAARAAGCPALALTDTNGLYGAVPFYRAARREGLHPVFGAEIETDPPTTRAVLLARDLTGFGEICRIITDRHLQPGFALATRLSACSHHVIILSADRHLLETVHVMRGPRDLYVELVRTGPRADPRLPALARRLRLPCVATNRVFFIHPRDWHTHRLLAAIRTRRTIGTLSPEAVAEPEAWLQPPGRMARRFRDVPEAVRNTLRIAEQCDVALPIGAVQLPPFAVPDGGPPFDHLCRLAREGRRRLMPRNHAAVQRLEAELRVIDDLRMASYFLIVWDIVREAAARGIPTVGRGSAANSLVCRVLGITQVDPLRHNLYFERFLNPERSDYPDIDLDFPWDRRDEMLDYVFEKYGRDHVALISTHVHFRSRSLVREVGRALGVPAGEIDAFTKPLPHFSDIADIENVRATVPECRDLPLADEPYRTILALSRRIDGFPRHLSIHCGGIVISPFPITDLIPLQTTPKGFAVTQYDMYPVEDMGLLKIDLLAQKGLAVVAEAVDAVRRRYGIIVDFDRIDPVSDPDTRNLVKTGRTMGCFYIESPGMRNLLQKLGVDTFEMLTAASSIIRPGVSDSGMMKAFIQRHNGHEAVRYLHPKLEPILRDTFGVMIYQEDVIKVAHAIAGMSLGEAEGLRKCMSKKRDWEDMAHYRQRFLDGAHRNDVPPETAREIWRQMESFAGYAFCKAHSASFALLSYQTAWLKAHYPAEFMAAVLSNRGGFYDACAYLEEARRMGLVILPPDIHESDAGFTAAHVSAGNPGSHRLAPAPRLPAADAESGGRTAPAGATRDTGNVLDIPPRANAVRVGLSQVKHLGVDAIRSILAVRRNGPYRSLDDFRERVSIDDSEIETLIRCGAMDGFGRSRPELLWQLKLLSRRSRDGTGDPRAAYLPGFQPGASRAAALIPRVSQYNLSEQLRADLECLDLTVAAHLLALYGITAEEPLRLTGSRQTPSGQTLPRRTGRHLAMDSIVPACDLPRHAGRLVSVVGWLVTAKRTRTARRRELMKFMTLEDPTACFEVTLFPKVYRRFGALVHDRGPYLVKGRVEREGLCCTLTALWLGRL